MSSIYDGYSEIAGPLRPMSTKVAYRKVMSRGDNRKLAALAVTYLVTVTSFITYLAWPSHLPRLAEHTVMYDVAAVFGAVLIVALQLVALVQTVSVLHYAYRAADPIPQEYPRGLRVAMLTTIVPSKEPFEIAKRTLLAAKKMRLDGGTIDVWLLDEGDDPAIKAQCEALGINHFSRKGVERWNTVEVRERARWVPFHRKLQQHPLRARTKHGNHNAWRELHEHKYDLVGQADPDHTALDGGEFFHRNVGYFNDPDVAYIVSPQVYDNHHNWIARGAAQLTYVFHGVIQRGCNGLGAPVLIGTNHIYRPSAWQQIGGYQDCIIEDHLTGMVLPATVNPATGNRWKGVYSPDICTAGEGPTSWSDFFSQQARWAYGIFEIATRHTPRVVGRLSRHQRISYLSLQFFYPSVSLTWAMGNALSALYLLFGVSASRLDPLAWFLLFTSSMTLGLSLTFWLRKFNLVPFERKGWGMTGMALNLFTTPVYLAAGVRQLLGRPLVYKVTAKGSKATGDSLRTFRVQLKWVAFGIVCLGTALLAHHDYPSLWVWMLLTVGYCLAPIAVWQREQRRAAVAAPRATDGQTAGAQTTVVAPTVLHGAVKPMSQLLADKPIPASADRELVRGGTVAT